MRSFRFAMIAGTSVCLLAGNLSAVSESTAVPELVVRNKTEKDRDRETSAERHRLAAEEKRLKTEERAMKIHNLPPEQVPAWVESDRSDEVLARLSALPRLAQEPVSPLSAVPPARMIRLGLASVAVVFLAALLWYRQKKERIARIKKKRT